MIQLTFTDLTEDQALKLLAAHAPLKRDLPKEEKKAKPAKEKAPEVEPEEIDDELEVDSSDESDAELSLDDDEETTPAPKKKAEVKKPDMVKLFADYARRDPKKNKPKLLKLLKQLNVKGPREISEKHFAKVAKLLE